MLQTEGYFSSHDNKDLYFQTYSSKDPVCRIIITHGIAEHSGSYNLFAKRLLDLMPVEVFAHDLRGHGRSYGKRGVVDSFQDYIKDLYSFYQFIESNLGTQLPLVFLGHSMGGLITTKFLLDYSSNLKESSFVLSSPFFGIAMKVSPIKDLAARWVADIMPNITLYNDIDYKSLSHDLSLVDNYEKDPLRHDRVSPRFYLDALDLHRNLPHQVSRLQQPCLFQLAGDDHIVDVSASLKIFDEIKTSQKVKKVYPNLYHEIYNEPWDLSEEVYKDLVAFLRKCK